MTNIIIIFGTLITAVLCLFMLTKPGPEAWEFLGENLGIGLIVGALIGIFWTLLRNRS